MYGITFDAGGLIALDRNDRRVIASLARATDLGMRVVILSDRHGSPGWSGRPPRSWFHSMGRTQLLLGFCRRKPPRRISSMPTS